MKFFTESMRYKYYVSGITIATDILFPELYKGIDTDTPDFRIGYGDVPEHLDNNQLDLLFVEGNCQQYLLQIPKIGRYLVVEDEIVIQPESNAPLPEVNKYILTHLLGVISYKKGFIPFHGGAFVVNDKAILISGISSIGKSALLAALLKKGFPIITDDISNVQMIDGKAMLYPSFPFLMVFNDTIKKLQLDETIGIKLRDDMEKYMYPLNEAWRKEPVELGEIYVLSNFGDVTQVVHYKGLKKLESIKLNLFHPWMMQILDPEKACLKQVLTVASKINLYDFNNDRTEQLTDFRDRFLKTVLKDVE